MLDGKRLTACVLTALLGACAAQQAQPTTGSASGEVTVGEADVVRARSGPEAGLPPLPRPLAQTSAPFRQGYTLALDVLGQSGPPPPPEGSSAAYELWTQSEFTTWIEARGRAVSSVITPFEEVAKQGADEDVISAALLGLIYQRTYEQFLGIAPPPGLAGDEHLIGLYRLGLEEAAKKWVDEASKALYHCAQQAARQTDPVFGLWLEFCHAHMQELAERRQAGEELAARLREEAEADRAAAIGPRPEGPEICWRPAAQQAAPEATAETVQPETTTTAATESAQSAAPKSGCARSPDADAAPAAPQSDRDRAYGVLDAATSVRVYVEAPDSETTRAYPLRTADTQARLARCFAKHVPDKDAVTVALHASLSLDQRGKVRSVEVTSEPSDLAKPPSKALANCVTQELRKTPFDCSISGQPTQTKALFCMRRERPAEPRLLQPVEP